MPSLNETQEELLRINKQIGERVRAMRRERRLSLRQMEERMSNLGWVLTSNRLSRLENGQYKWNTASLSAVASVLGVSICELVNFKDENIKEEYTISDRTEREILILWRSNKEVSLMEWLIKRWKRLQNSQANLIE